MFLKLQIKILTLQNKRHPKHLAAHSFALWAGPPSGAQSVGAKGGRQQEPTWPTEWHLVPSSADWQNKCFRKISD